MELHSTLKFCMCILVAPNEMPSMLSGTLTLINICICIFSFISIYWGRLTHTAKRPKLRWPFWISFSFWNENISHRLKLNLVRRSGFLSQKWHYMMGKRSTSTYAWRFFSWLNDWLQRSYLVSILYNIIFMSILTRDNPSVRCKCWLKTRYVLIISHVLLTLHPSRCCAGAAVSVGCISRLPCSQSEGRKKGRMDRELGNISSLLPPHRSLLQAGCVTADCSPGGSAFSKWQQMLSPLVPADSPSQVISPSVPPSALGFSYSLTLSLQMSFIRLITNYSRLLVISFLLGPSLIQNPNPRECGSTRQILHCMGWALELMPLSPSPARNFLYLIRRHSAWHTSHCHGSGGWTTVPHRQNTEGSGRESLTGSQREKGKAFSRRNRILWWEHSESTQ